MIRTWVVGAGLALLLAASSESQAQFGYNYPYGSGYGGYGFGGWTGTAEGSIARGLGAYAAGEGIYDLDNAQAASIDENTIQRWNQFLYNSELEGRRRYAATHQRKLNMDKASYNARMARIRQEPSKDDIDSGDALNAILDQISDPKLIGGSAIRLLNSPVPAAAVRGIPFQDETDAITLSLDQLTDPNAWPFALRSDDFKPEREAYQKAVDDALAEDKEGGTLKPETVAKVRQAVSLLFKKVDAKFDKKNPQHLQAINYLNSLAGMSRMLERSNVDAILAQLEKVENTSTGNLIAFMHSYNLRFGAATTPQQRSIYRSLTPVMAADRDKLVGKLGDANNRPAPGDENSPPPTVDNPTALFHPLNPSHLHPKDAPPPAPTNPANPNLNPNP